MRATENEAEVGHTGSASQGFGACVLDGAGAILFHDDAFASLVGGRAEHGRTTGGSGPADGRDGSPLRGALFEQLGPGLTLRSGSVAEVSVAGKTLQIRTTRLPGASGPAWICAVQDVTESRRTKARMEISVETLTSLVEASPLAILTLDLDKNVDMWNPAAEKIFGWTRAEIKGKPYPIVPADRWIEFSQLFDRVMRGEGFTGVEARREGKGGRILDLSISTAPLRDASGKVTGAMALLEDLTAKKNLEQRYRHAQKMEAVGRLAGGVAHDFNNLLTVILGTCDLLMLGAGKDGDLAADLETIRHCGSRAAELTASLLAFSRRQVMQPQVLDLNGLVHRITPILQRLIGDAVHLDLRLDTQIPPVLADAGQVEQILVNLAVNAKDAMPEGGRLTVQTELVAVRDQDPLKPGSYVTIEVTDTGPGIPPEILPCVFEPFFTTKGMGQGTGLGLATVYGIAHQSGGTVEVHNASGRGARFRVFLPRAAHNAQVPSPKRFGTLACGTETILLVENDASVRTTTTHMLESLGYRVLSAADGASALELCGEHTTIDLLLTDAQLNGTQRNGMGGSEVARRFSELRPDTPVVLMSGRLRPDLDDDTTVFLPKPLRLNVLATEVRAVLDRCPQRTAERTHNDES
ncbi:MAG: PAS domain S-box protein [Nannocystaceae bacterium]|nr:PAS domain S-box protein [Nannocystaceae bacterium]